MRTTTRRQFLTTGIALTALAVAGCSDPATGTHASSNRLTSSTHASTASTTAPRTRTPSTAPHDPLTGGKRTANPVIAVKLENTTAAMPQYGLSAADIIFVEEVEGGLTRLMPIYHSAFPARVEPVRSARSTDIAILPAFGKPLLVYSGVASQVRSRLQRAPISLDDNGLRDPRRPAPHNLYFDLAALARGRGHSGPPDIGLRFAATDARVRRAPREPRFTVRIGNDRFSFSYNGSRYLPSWNGRPYTDAGAGGKRVTATNVLVLETRSVSDGYRDPAGTPVYRTVSTGSGNLSLYRDGKRLSGTWQRSDPSGPFRFHDAHGKTLSLAAGRTWILLQT